MNSKILGAAVLAAAFIPGIANAERTTGAPEPAQRYQATTNPVTSFLTWLIIPSATGERPIPYADNPQLIGHRHGSTDAAWHK